MNKLGFYANLTRAAILAMVLAFYRVFVEDWWFKFASSRTDGGVGVGTIAIGYFFAAVFAFLFTYFFAHRMETEVG